MSHPANSMIASLVYARRPKLNFAGAVAEMDAALREVGATSYRLLWDQDDLVSFDVDGSRVVLGLGDAQQAPSGRISAMVATLVISIGTGPKTGFPGKLASHSAALLSAIVERFHASHPPECTLWSEIDHVFTADDFELMLAEAAEALIIGKRAKPAPKPAAFTAEARFGTPEVERLMRRLVHQITPRSPAKTGVSLPPPMPPGRSRQIAAPVMLPHGQTALPPLPVHAADFANDAPGMPHPMVGEMRSIRQALYPARPAMPQQRCKAPLPQRLTIYTMNTTLMLVALPVGSAILVYNMIRGEDLNMNARAIAATSTIVGLAQLLGQHGLLSV